MCHVCPSNDRDIDAGDIFLNLDQKRGCGTQRPLKTPRPEAAFLDDDVTLFHTEPDGSYQDKQDKDRIEWNRCDKERLNQN